MNSSYDQYMNQQLMNAQNELTSMQPQQAAMQHYYNPKTQTTTSSGTTISTGGAGIMTYGIDSVGSLFPISSSMWNQKYKKEEYKNYDKELFLHMKDMVEML